MLVLLGVFKGERDGATHVVVFMEDGQLYLLLLRTDLVVLLVGKQVEFDVHLHRTSESAEEGTEFVLGRLTITIAQVDKIKLLPATGHKSQTIQTCR